VWTLKSAVRSHLYECGSVNYTLVQKAAVRLYSCHDEWKLSATALIELEDYALKEGRVTESCEVLNICLNVCASETLDILTIPHEGPTEPRSETSVHSTSLQVKSEI